MRSFHGLVHIIHFACGIAVTLGSVHYGAAGLFQLAAILQRAAGAALAVLQRKAFHGDPAVIANIQQCFCAGCEIDIAAAGIIPIAIRIVDIADVIPVPHNCLIHIPIVNTHMMRIRNEPEVGRRYPLYEIRASSRVLM